MINYFETIKSQNQISEKIHSFEINEFFEILEKSNFEISQTF